MMAKKVLALFLVLVCVLPVTACNKSDFADASVTVPASWALYSCDELSFRFEAGYTPLSEEDDTLIAFQNTMSGLFETVDHLNRCLLSESPARDIGTHDFLLIGYYRTVIETVAADLKSIMEELNDLDAMLFDLHGDIGTIQKSRIRLYGSVEALTYCLRLDKSVMQLALVPRGTRIFVIVYCDNTSGADNNYLERLLSSLTIR